MSWVPVGKFIFAVFIFGFIWILGNEVIVALEPYGMAGDVKTFILGLWNTACPLFALLFAGIWLLMRMQKREYQPGGL